MTIYKVTMDNIMLSTPTIYDIEYCNEILSEGEMSVIKKNGSYYKMNSDNYDVVYVDMNANYYSRTSVEDIKKRIINDVRDDLINRIL